METKEIANKVMKEPQEFKNFCENLILKYNKLSEDELNHLMNQVDKLNLEQIEILLNKISLAKLDILHLINKSK